MALTPEQRHNAQIILRVGKRMGASKKALKAALETGLTESNLRNLSYGDRDSVGVFQQRASQGWKGLTNVERAAKEFYAQAIPNAQKYGTAGQLAQSVQRSAFPGRYDQHSAQANALLRGTAAPKGASYGRSSAPVASATTGDAKTQIALSLLGMGNLGASYSAPDPLTTALIEAAKQQKAPKPAQAAPSYGPSPAGASGRLLGHPQDRPGAHTSKAIVSFVSQVAGVYGKPVRLGTGTAHNRLTVNGNVSAHWAGNALDLPASGKQNLALGRAALVAAGMPAAQARKARGGIYNIGGKQIIFQTNEGGNHFNHVHVGLRAGR